MDTITIFGITVKVNRVAFTVFGGWSVYWYGIIIAVGVMLALLYGMKNGDRFGIKPDHIFDSFIVVLPCSILAARAYYIIFDPVLTFKDFFGFNSKHGFAGLAIYGGIIGAAIVIFIMQRVYKFSVLAALDITSVGLLIGQGIGRWGNFVNQEAYGIATGSSWFGMTGNIIASEMGEGVLVHPCFLYESVWCILGFFVLNYFSKKAVFKGQTALMYGIWYGFERTFIELLRTDSLMLGNIRVSSLLSAVLCISCGITLYVILKKKKEAACNNAYEGQFSKISEMEISNPIIESEQSIVDKENNIEENKNENN